MTAGGDSTEATDDAVVKTPSAGSGLPGVGGPEFWLLMLALLAIAGGTFMVRRRPRE